jgi:prepilin-type N-terminal cleavage/methylation domain-containing protein
MKNQGFTLVEIMIVIAIIGLLAVMALPSYVRARSNSQVSTCVNNLRQIEGAKDVFAIENFKTTGETVTDADVNPYLKKAMADTIEPAGGTYTLRAIGTSPTCSVGGLHTL